MSQRLHEAELLLASANALLAASVGKKVDAAAYGRWLGELTIWSGGGLKKQIHRLVVRGRNVTIDGRNTAVIRDQSGDFIAGRHCDSPLEAAAWIAYRLGTAK